MSAGADMDADGAVLHADGDCTDLINLRTVTHSHSVASRAESALCAAGSLRRANERGGVL